MWVAYATGEADTRAKLIDPGLRARLGLKDS